MADKRSHFILVYIYTISLTTFAQNWNNFTFNGFGNSNLYLDVEGATIHPNGLLQLTDTSKQLTSHAFYPIPLYLANSSFSFSTTFAFAMDPEIHVISGHGIVFVISPSTNFIHGVAGRYFGLFSPSSNGSSSNHIFAVELDTVQDLEFQDVDSNHVGIDINGLISNASSSAGYFSEAEGKNKTLNLISSKPMQVWIEYDDNEKVVKVTMAPLGTAKPSRPLVISRVDLSQVLLDSMYVGFSSSTGSVASSHYLLGWSFKHGGLAQELDLSKLPSLPWVGKKGTLGLGRRSLILVIIISAVVVIMVLGFLIMRRKKYEEVLEDWEQEYLVQRFSYKDLYEATQGFKDKELLGSGGFGKVYKGILTSTKAEVAVKRVSHGSSQGMREFVAEIGCLRMLRHRNLVQLLGYCRRKAELLLVYDYMPNGSLDKFLFTNEKPTLGWTQRLKIIKGVASALLYLHDHWEQVVLHRDVKASNVLLDDNMDARLGDFGLARLYDHDKGPQTTRLVGTIGYLAPELSKNGKPTTRTDVFAFGTFMLEVACGRRPTGLHSLEGESLVDWVFECWKKEEIRTTSDSRLEGNYEVEEMEMILKLGLFCCQANPEKRPNMRQVFHFLDGNASLIDDSLMQIYEPSMPYYLSSNRSASAGPLSSNDSILVVGR